MFDDTCLPKWKEQREKNKYLNMGIPTKTTNHEDVGIRYGNPFDKTITIGKNG